ncbi:MAG TPA: S8 family serine peptidase, partial [Pirellulaceae bacterium]
MASDLGTQYLPGIEGPASDSDAIRNPFIPGAVTLDAMVSRAKARSYVPGDLVVATSTAVGAPRTVSMDWGSLIGSRLDSEPVTLASFEDASSGGFVNMLHLNLADSTNLVAAMGTLANVPGVLWSAPNFIHEGADPRDLVPDDPQYASQYHHPLMQNNLAWDTTLGISSIRIGVTDDGVSLAHVDLNPNIWVNAGEIPGNGVDDEGNGRIDDVNGWDFISNDNNPNHNGSDSHGTHVSGIAAARTNNATGVAGTAGGSTILPIKFYNGATPGSWTSTVIFNSYKYGTDNGAKIISTSYNVDSWVGDATVTAGYNYMHSNGVLHFNSAGNNSQLNPPRQAFEQTLLVASTTNTDAKSSFSNYGTGVDISAPGSDIRSTLPGNTYGLNSGTSMATPNAAGVAALIWSANPTWTRDQVAAQLISTADNIDVQNPTLVGLLGGGRVNSFKGVTQTLAAPRITSLTGIPSGVVPLSTMLTNFKVRYNQVMDATSVTTLANYDLRGAGPDNSFGTMDDVVYPLTIPNSYFVGTNEL